MSRNPRNMPMVFIGMTIKAKYQASFFIYARHRFSENICQANNNFFFDLPPMRKNVSISRLLLHWQFVLDDWRNYERMQTMIAGEADFLNALVLI
jgi:hypothetical protein